MAVTAACLLTAGAAAIALEDSPRPAASRPPVVLLIFDEFPGDALLGPDGRIDAKRYPAFAELAGSSWWFRNAYASFDFTRQAVPLIFDGRRPVRGGGGSRQTHPKTIYDVLGRRGYGVVAHEDVTALCPPRWCPGGPPRSPDTLKALGSGRPERLRRWIGRMGPERAPDALPEAHAPAPRALPVPARRDTARGTACSIPINRMNREGGYHDPYLTRHNEQRFLLQLGFVDRQLGAMIARLKKTGLYDRALVVAVADHGESFETDVPSRRDITQRNVDEVGPVPFFVKLPGQKRARVSGALARTLDVMPTIADVLNVPVGFRTHGRSAFGRAARTRRSCASPCGTSAGRSRSRAARG